MGIITEEFGRTGDGARIQRYVLKCRGGMEASFLNYGATVMSLLVPDRRGEKADVALGYDDVAGYENGTNCFGGFMGRCCNRIGGASFTLDGVRYELDKNDNGNCLHSGFRGFHNMVYVAEVWEDEKGPAVTFRRKSPDGEQGMPGNLEVSVTYVLTHENALVIEYEATSDRDTVVNLTNHTYFNLAGQGSGTVLGHKAKIYADRFTPTDGELIPTGEIADVAGTPMDFREWKEIGQDIGADYEPIRLAGGYDHNYEIRGGGGGGLVLAAELWDGRTGRRMEVRTDLPGVQFYAGNFIEGIGKGGKAYERRSGACFETQLFPNAVNCPNFRSPVLRAGETFRSTTEYRFYAE